MQEIKDTDDPKHLLFPKFNFKRNQLGGEEAQGEKVKTFEVKGTCTEGGQDHFYLEPQVCQDTKKVSETYAHIWSVANVDDPGSALWRER